MQESNPRPTDYKSVALPAELIRRLEAKPILKKIYKHPRFRRVWHSGSRNEVGSRTADHKDLVLICHTSKIASTKMHVDLPITKN